MRSLIATALLSCASLAQAGTFTADLTTDGLQLRDLTPSDGAAPTFSLDPGLSTEADWKKPLHLGGEFWQDHTTGVWTFSLSASGTLGAHSGLEWNGDLDFDGTMTWADFKEEHVFIYGGIAGSTSSGFRLQTDIPPTTFSSFDVVHEPSSLGLLVRNDSDEASSFELNMFIDITPHSDFIRPVPEPSTYLLMAGGLALLPLVRRKRQPNNT